MNYTEITLLLAVYVVSAFVGTYRAGKVFAVERNARVFTRDLAWCFVPGANTLYVCTSSMRYALMYSGPVDRIFPMTGKSK